MSFLIGLKLQCQVTLCALKTILYFPTIFKLSHNSLPFSSLSTNALKTSEINSLLYLLFAETYVWVLKCNIKPVKLSLPPCITTQNTGIIFGLFLTVLSWWPTAQRNSAGSLKWHLQSWTSSAEVWIMWKKAPPTSLFLPSLLHSSGGGAGMPPTRCWPALALEVKGHRLIVGVWAGLLGRNVTAVEPDHVALHQLEVNRLRPPLTLCGLN